MSSTSRYVVQRVHNNNVVLALDGAGTSVVLTGSGVGFGKRRGSVVEPAQVDAVYVPQGRTRPEVAAGTLAEIPREVVETAREIVEVARATTGLTRPEILLLPIADHLHQALRRAQSGIGIDIPLVWEVRHLYPRELAAGRQALDLVRTRLNARLPEDEATAFALHFVSANFTGAVLDRTVAMTQALTQTFDLLDVRRTTPIDRQGEAATRFVTHLRYLFVRLAEGKDVPDAPALVREALNASVPDAVRLARQVAEILQGTWGMDVSEDEVAYIALHLHRLQADEGPVGG